MPAATWRCAAPASNSTWCCGGASPPDDVEVFGDAGVLAAWTALGR